MAIREILKFPDDSKQLRRKSVKVEHFQEVRGLIRDLKDTLNNHPGAGLAAPQIGVHYRVIVVRFGQDEGEMKPPLALINPQIVAKGELSTGFDGCLSVPNLLTWDILRPSWLVVSALNERGKQIKLKVKGIDARLIHHEVDHLEGILFIDRLQLGDKLYKVVDTEEGEKIVNIDQFPLFDDLKV